MNPVENNIRRKASRGVPAPTEQKAARLAPMKPLTSVVERIM